ARDPGPQRADVAIATRRIKQLTDANRAAIASDGLASPPRLDMMAVLEDEVAWAKASGTRFGLVLVHLPGISALRDGEGRDDADARLRTAAETIARAGRATDVIAGSGDDFLVVLADADAGGSLVAAKRVARAIGGASLRAAQRPKKTRGFAAWSIGRASYPADGTTRDALIARATASLSPF
ncbi:MAG TPA: diguanylate cyclase, partial [Caldimonas sp.]|nr:diguanylate cyclase [Caldimonas sp.]